MWQNGQCSVKCCVAERSSPLAGEEVSTLARLPPSAEQSSTHHREVTSRRTGNRWRQRGKQHHQRGERGGELLTGAAQVHDLIVIHFLPSLTLRNDFCQRSSTAQQRPLVTHTVESCFGAHHKLVGRLTSKKRKPWRSLLREMVGYSPDDFCGFYNPTELIKFFHPAPPTGVGCGRCLGPQPGAKLPLKLTTKVVSRRHRRSMWRSSTMKVGDLAEVSGSENFSLISNSCSAGCAIRTGRKRAWTGWRLQPGQTASHDERVRHHPCGGRTDRHHHQLWRREELPDDGICLTHHLWSSPQCTFASSPPTCGGRSAIAGG